MSGSFESIHVPPTLVSFAVSYGDAANIVSPEFKAAGSALAMLSPEYDEAGLPVPASLNQCFALIEKLLLENKILSAYTLGKGGAAEALFKMSLGNRIGFRLNEDIDPASLFQKQYGSFILELAEKAKIASISGSVSCNTALIPVGVTTREYTITSKEGTIAIKELEALYSGRLASVYPFLTADSAEHDTISIPALSFDRKQAAAAGRTTVIRSAKPLALIPVFPGTNCEYDTARALREAGAEPHITVIRNLDPKSVADSVAEIAKQIARSQIIVLPGGFSGGDEPDGSGKFITAFFRNPLITEQVRELLQKRDGLMLGICNGFQALIKLGLVPFGDITETDAHCPTLASNRIGRHQSRLVQTRIASNLSPCSCLRRSARLIRCLFHMERAALSQRRPFSRN